MPTNYGLLQTGSDTINSFMTAYQTAQKDKRDSQMMGLLTGMQKDENGDYQYTPQKQAQLDQQNQLAAKQNQDTQDELDPNSDVSAKARALFSANGVKGTDGMSAHDLKQYMPFSDEQQKKQGMIGAAATKNTPNDYKDMKDDQKSLMNDPLYKKSQSGLAEVNNINNQLDEAAKGNPISANMMPVIIARLSTGGQRLNKNEIEAAGGNKAVDSQIEQLIQKAKSGTLTQDNISSIRGFVNASSRGDQDLLENTIQQHAQLRASNKNIDPSMAYLQLTGRAKAQSQQAAGNSFGGGLIGNSPQSPAATIQTKVINGETYQKVPGGWKRVQQPQTGQ